MLVNGPLKALPLYVASTVILKYFGEQSDFSMWIQVTEYYIIQETRLIFILPRVKVLTIRVSAASNAELPKPNKTSN